jgi:cytochrome c oxidase subunit 2
VTVLYAVITTLLASLAIIAVALLVNGKRFPPAAVVAATATIYRIRAVYFLIIVGAAIILLVFTLPMTPYPTNYGGTKPDVTVKAIGQMWAWMLTPGSGATSAGANLVLPVGKTVEFQVSANDVNHNFAIYNSEGELIAQVQAMPDYTNRLFYTFNVPGHYYVLCLEYCGALHHAMNAEFDVK